MDWVLHETDLFRPHNDPDDHWDLACQFALAKKGLTDLRGVLIDYPPILPWEPDVGAVAQLSWLTGIPVPVGIGQKPGDEKECSGVNLLRRTLEEAPGKVAIHIVGSCHDIARCGMRWPELFAEKVKAIYLNAGSGVDSDELEYNVNLDPQSYAMIFRLPCPVYWMPCFHIVRDPLFVEGQYGTFYKFRQADLFTKLSNSMLNFHLSVLRRTESSRWLSTLEAPVDERAVAYFEKMERNMYSTAGFLHGAGLTIWKDGTIAPLGQAPEKEIFQFLPVEVTCEETGHAHWKETSAPTNRYIYSVTDVPNYSAAMSRGLAEVVSWLDQP